MPKSNQKGGMGLPAITDLAVPLGLTIAAHWLSDVAQSDAGSVVLSSDVASDLSLDDLSFGSELDEMDEMEGGAGDWTQVVTDLATPALLTAGAHLMASDAESDASARYSEMAGGNVGAAVLKTLDDLIVPLGLMTGSHWLRSQVEAQEQEGGSLWGNLVDLSVPVGLTLVAHNLKGNKRSQRAQRGGAGLPVIGDGYLGKWLGDNGINFLSPDTLLPLGLIFVLYMAYRRYSENTGDSEVKLSGKPNIGDMAKRQDLRQYAKRNNIKQLDPNTKFPFALAMGKDVFNQYVQQME